MQEVEIFIGSIQDHIAVKLEYNMSYAMLYKHGGDKRKQEIQTPKWATKSPFVKKLSWEEMEECREKRTYFNFHEPFAPRNASKKLF